ncbi:hypothetical protein E4K10_42345 [Streptomyces sp. T1317-0309]|nr:hypothetical protein E4K10_42345 [Streptomyces sp. T1317-0309]
MIRTVNDHFSDPAPLPPAAVSASNADARTPRKPPSTGQQQLVGTGYSGDSAGQYLQANYGRPVELEKMIITPGVSRQVEDRSQARPERLDVLLTDARGAPHSCTTRSPTAVYRSWTRTWTTSSRST